jgi:hypothetical protein
VNIINILVLELQPQYSRIFPTFSIHYFYLKIIAMYACIYIYTVYSLYDTAQEESAFFISKGISEEVLWAEQSGFESWQEQEIISFPKYPDELWGLPSLIFNGYNRLFRQS